MVAGPESPSSCQVSWCDRPGKPDLCRPHQIYLHRYGRLPLRGASRDPMTRLWMKVDKTETCWLWTGSRGSEGRYGHVQHDGRLMPAHRFAYTLLVGPIPDGMVLDHLCGVTLCVRPDHLEPVTQAENLRRALGGTVGACRRGHPWTPENTRVRPDGKRTCRSCVRIKNAKRIRG